MDRLFLWHRFQAHLCTREELGLTLDVSRMLFDAGFLEAMEAPLAGAFDSMEQLERGAIANPDEGRQVGHYWLRAPERAPTPEITTAIREMQTAVRDFTLRIHDGSLGPAQGGLFTDFLVIGIGGSALGPQLLADSLGDPKKDRLQPHFFDNTDPDGMERVLRRLGDRLRSTLCLVVSKSGGTQETRNGMEVAREAFKAGGLDFARHTVAVTGEGSALDRLARAEDWLARFPMWSWVGGRTSVTSAVGLLPAALQGIDIDTFLRGAAACDEATRERDGKRNPAAMLALMWFHATGGRGTRDMVLLPYKDRLVLFSRYLQQLVMESLGKSMDLDGNPVEQGIAVYGNKGSTDQHAYVQQLRDGLDNAFVTFIEVLEDGGSHLEVQPGITSGDYLRGFLHGTREALTEKGRPSMTLTLQRVDAFSLGALVALYERAVGLYASLIHVNAYHQPGVEAGKRAATRLLEIQVEICRFLHRTLAASVTAEEVAEGIGRPEEAEAIFHLLEGLAANHREVRRIEGVSPSEVRYAPLLEKGNAP